MLPVSIREYECLMGCSCCMGVNDGKIYDIMGRKLTEIPLGKMYIRNNKKYIRYE
jgi:hypothetical protein